MKILVARRVVSRFPFAGFNRSCQFMIKKILIILVFTWANLPWCSFAQDFKFIYFSTGGTTPMATQERIEVEGDQVTLFRHAKELGEGSEKRKSTRSYPVSKPQLQKLIEIVKSSGFMTWPKNPEVADKTHADEYIEITLDGKTVRHTKWERGYQEQFRILYTHFNSWFTRVRSIQF